MVDDEPQMLSANRAILRASGYEDIIDLQDSRDVIPLLRESGHEIGMIVLDLYMPHLSGKDLLPSLTAEFPYIPVIVMTGINDIEVAVQCMRAGAVDYLVKPVESNRFVAAVSRSLEVRNLRTEVDSLKQYMLTDSLKNERAFSAIVTGSNKMKAIFQYVEAVAVSLYPVLITGETGVGKELIARVIHDLCGRGGEFVSVNAAGLDDNMFSDTLFGHKKGAYTGAVQSREGLASRAGKGTLFLDEIGDLNNASQLKLLRLIQDGTYYTLGSDLPRKSHARIVAATNKDLQRLLDEGMFRKDLYYRLCAHRVHIPSLRERPEDIPVLAGHFIEESAKVLKKQRPEMPPEMPALLAGYDFPGNVRELKAMIFDAVIRSNSGVLRLDGFRHAGGGPEAPAGRSLQPSESCLLEAVFGHFPSLSEAEAYLMDEALRLAGGKQGAASSYLGITRQALNKRLRRKTIQS